MRRLFSGAVDRNELQLEDVFTPGTVARHTYVRRKGLEAQLKDALREIDRQVFIQGSEGVGKSSVLQYVLHNYAIDHICVHCTGSTDFDEIKLLAFDELDPFGSDPFLPAAEGVKAFFRQLPRNIKKWFGLHSPADNLGTHRGGTDMRLTNTRLAECLVNASKILVLEDFHLLQDSVKDKVWELAGTFSEAALQGIPAKLVLVSAGAHTNPQSPVTVVYVPKMNAYELLAIIRTGEKLLNIVFSVQLRQFLLRCAETTPRNCQRVCYKFCENHGVRGYQPRKIRFTDSLGSRTPVDK